MTGTDAIDVLAEIAHHRNMYRALWHVACEREREIARLEALVEQMMDERRRWARQLFGVAA